MLKKPKAVETAQQKGFGITENSDFLDINQLQDDFKQTAKKLGWTEKEAEIGCGLLFTFVCDEITKDKKQSWDELSISVKSYILSVVSQSTYKKIRNLLSDIPADTYRDHFSTSLLGDEKGLIILSDEENEQLKAIQSGEVVITNSLWESLTEEQKATLFTISNDEEINQYLCYIGSIEFLQISECLQDKERCEVFRKIEPVNLEAMMVELVDLSEILFISTLQKEDPIMKSWTFSQEDIEKKVADEQLKCISNNIEELQKIRLGLSSLLENPTLTETDKKIVRKQIEVLECQKVWMEAMGEVVAAAKKCLTDIATLPPESIKARDVAYQQEKATVANRMKERLLETGLTVSEVIESIENASAYGNYHNGTLLSYTEPTLSGVEEIIKAMGAETATN